MRKDAGQHRIRPTVGVMCCNRILDGRPVQAVADRFLKPLADIADVNVLIVPAIPGAFDPASLAGMLDGLLLTGSCSNVEPARYGSEAHPVRPDADRDETALRLAGAMIEAGRTLFGICRGMQEINVLHGGTLRTDLGDLGHHRPGTDDVEEIFDHGHRVSITPGGVLSRLWGVNGGTVNSVHNQGVDRIGRGLQVEALAHDGVVEAFSAKAWRAPIVGVQWHPEWDAYANPWSRGYFSMLGRAARGDVLAA